jgi:tetratricopeptide (TPR) repeat protein
VFRGAFDLDAITAVVDPEVGDPYPVLASLVRQSMVSSEGRQTYRLLRPSRDHAADRAAAGPRYAGFRDRHATYVAAATARAGREMRTTTTALSRLHRLLPDARAALEWALERERLEQAADVAVAYTWYWTINGRVQEGIRWLSAVSTRADREAPAARLDATREAAVLRSLALLSNPAGRVREAVDLCERSLRLSRAVGDESGSTAALLTLGVAQWALGDFAAAAAAHDEAHDLAVRTGERWHRLAAATLRARTALDAGEPDARARIEAAIEAGQVDQERQMLAIAMALLARHHLGAGDLDAAELAAERALHEADRIGYREGELGALNLLGRVLLARGQPDQAATWFTRALRGAVEAAHRGALCETLESMALAAAASGRHEHAYLLLHASRRERTRLGLQVPAASAADVRDALAATAEVLGAATSLVEARVMLMRLDDLVAELLRTGAADPAPAS